MFPVLVLGHIDAQHLIEGKQGLSQCLCSLRKRPKASIWPLMQSRVRKNKLDIQWLRPKEIKLKYSYSIIISNGFEQASINCVKFEWHKLIRIFALYYQHSVSENTSPLHCLTTIK